MDEQQARDWLANNLNVPRETIAALEQFTAFLAIENEGQNLVSRQTLSVVWGRHIIDSAQLLLHAPPSAKSWIDLGTGAGFPGLIVALLRGGAVTLVEERRKRADFLRGAAILLGITHRVEILENRVETMPARPFDVISARAFAPLDRLLMLGERFAAPMTRWVLPKGRNAKSELEAVRASWQGEFRLVPSVTDADAQIIVAEQVRRRGQGKQKQ